MRLVFVDESARDDDYYFFGALIADAAAIRSIETGLDGIGQLLARQVDGFDAHTEFHAAEIFHGKGAWRSVPVVWRVKACTLVAKVLARSTARFVLRGVDLGALRARYGSLAHPPHLLTLAHLLECVHDHLGRLDHDEQLGLVLADEHHSAVRARRSLREFKLDSVPGYTRRPLTRIADTIYFGPSHESRMLQAADLATFFLNRARTITEHDARTAAGVAKVAELVRSVTLVEYVWSPQRHNAPR